MTPSFKPLFEDLLQERLNGKLNTPEDMLTILSRHIVGDLSFEDHMIITEFCMQMIPCHNIPAAKELATKFGLTLRV